MSDKDKHEGEKWIKFVQSIDSDITPQAIRLIGEWRRISHSMHQLSTASLINSGLTEAQYLVLLSLYMNEEIHGRSELNPSEISKWRGTSRNTISSLIRGLENDGFIERHLDKEDRRKFNICLTTTGRAKVSKYVHINFKSVGSCFNKLSEAEQETLAHLLNKLNNNLKDAHAELENKATTGD